MSALGVSDDSRWPSLASATVATEYLERIRLFDNRSRIVLSDALADHPNGGSFHAVWVTTTVCTSMLDDVVLDADSMILFKDGQAIPETAYFEPPDAIRHLPIGTALTTVSDDEDLILAYNNAHSGYQHWLTQCVPAIDWALRRKRTRPVRLLLPRLEPWQEEILTLLDYSRIPRLTLDSGMKYRLPRLEYADFLRGTASFSVCMSLRETARRIASRTPPVPTRDKILYIDEVQPYYGPLCNEGDVLDMLRRHGVTIVSSGRLGITERINLFRNADAVIGPLGQGLTDVLFCRPGTLLWEWMPRHQQNASFNRLAQAGGMDYWGDLFETLADPFRPGLWQVDLNRIAQGLSQISARPVQPAGSEPQIVADQDARTSQPIDELMLRFESLGDNCEFGLVQRHGGSEPLGLLRFNGFFVPPEFRLEKLMNALDRRFDGLAASNTVTVFADGIPGQRELIVRESVYEFWYHTGIAEGTIEPEAQSEREIVRLGFLRRKLLADLKTGEKIWVWKSQATTHRDQLQPLLRILRGIGPNTLLWVVEADEEHAAGTIEPVEDDFIKGYVERFAPYGGVTNIDFASWLKVCWRAEEFRHGSRPAHEPEPHPEASSRPPSAMEYLASVRSSPPLAGVTAKTGASRFWRWLRR